MGKIAKRTLAAVQTELEALETDVTAWNARLVELETLAANDLQHTQPFEAEYAALSLKLKAAPQKRALLESERDQLRYLEAKAAWADALKAWQAADKVLFDASTEKRLMEIRAEAYNIAFREHLQPLLTGNVTRAKTRLYELIAQMEKSGHATLEETSALRATITTPHVLMVSHLDQARREFAEQFARDYGKRFGILEAVLGRLGQPKLTLPSMPRLAQFVGFNRQGEQLWRGGDED